MRSMIAALGLSLGVLTAAPAKADASWLSEALHYLTDGGYYGPVSYGAYPYTYGYVSPYVAPYSSYYPGTYLAPTWYPSYYPTYTYSYTYPSYWYNYRWYNPGWGRGYYGRPWVWHGGRHGWGEHHHWHR